MHLCPKDMETCFKSYAASKYLCPFATAAEHRSNQTHRLSRWYAPRLQGDDAGSPTRALKNSPIATSSQAAAKAAFLLCFIILATRKRVDVFPKRQLFHGLVFRQLIPDVRGNRMRISSRRVDVIPATPEMTIPVLVF